MLISQAFAQDEAAPVTQTTATTSAADPMMTPIDTKQVMIQNVGLIVLLVVMFYFLLIRPQQRRFKEHKAMVDSLKKGDKVITGGGLIGTVHQLVNDEEVIVDLGNDLKVTAVRGLLQVKVDAPVKDSSKK